MGNQAKSRNFDKNPDEVIKMPNGKTHIVKFGDATIAKITAEPGWRWSKDVKPIVNTNTCQLTHTGYALSGRLGVRMEDGSEQEFGPGDAMYVPPGHDSWVIGNDPFVELDFTGFTGGKQEATSSKK
jgi:hypothetical protein